MGYCLKLIFIRNQIRHPSGHFVSNLPYLSYLSYLSDLSHLPWLSYLLFLSYLPYLPDRSHLIDLNCLIYVIYLILSYLTLPYLILSIWSILYLTYLSNLSNLSKLSNLSHLSHSPDSEAIWGSYFKYRTLHVCVLGRACWCCCRVPLHGLLEGASIRVACALWSWLAGAAVGRWCTGRAAWRCSYQSAVCFRVPLLRVLLLASRVRFGTGLVVATKCSCRVPPPGAAWRCCC